MESLTIAVDASRITTAQRTGTENYALQLIRALIALDSPHRFDLYFRDEPPAGLLPEHPRVRRIVIPFPRLWTHVRLAASLWRSRPDVTFVPAHALPYRFPGAAVVTVHDLGYVYFPNAHPDWNRRYLEWSTRHSVDRATRIVVDSLATAQDLAAHYGVSENKMQLVYPGVDESIRRVEDPSEIAAVRQRYGLPEHYLLSMGKPQRRKNIGGMVQAFRAWRTAYQSNSCALVLAGQQGWLYDPQWTEGVEGVILPGYVADDDVAALYSGAQALLFPSLHEGFGFPVLEAMRCGTPVITSTTSSLPEVAGDAALLVNAREVGEIAESIARILSDEALRKDLIVRGYQQAARFSWRQAAEQTLATLESSVSIR